VLHALFSSFEKVPMDPLCPRPARCNRRGEPRPPNFGKVGIPNSVMCGKSNLSPILSSDTRTTDPPFQVLTEGQFAQVERKVCSKGWFGRSVWWSFCRRRPFSRGFPSQGEIFCCRTSTPDKYKSKGSAKVGFKVPGVAQAHQPPCFSARQLFVLKPNSTTAELARSGHFC